YVSIRASDRRTQKLILKSLERGPISTLRFCATCLLPSTLFVTVDLHHRSKSLLVRRSVARLKQYI
ncbi:MAG: hypothetical protein LBF72_04000, partial [Holosporales bacterium]|nr:hypothetical protein [Holosporales bacterium]